MRVFLSYSREDKALVEKLLPVIKGGKFEVFMDVDIPHGDNFRTAIEEELSQSHCVVTFWSNSSVKSRYVIEEAQYGFERGMLVPVIIDNVSPPFGFAAINAANLIGWDGEEGHREVTKLLNAISLVTSTSSEYVEDVNKQINEILDPLPRKDYAEFKTAVYDINSSVVKLMDEIKEVQIRQVENTSSVFNKTNKTIRVITSIFLLGAFYTFYLTYNLAHDLSVFSQSSTRSNTILSDALPRITRDINSISGTLYDSRNDDCGKEQSPAQ